jgi:uncharacterized radical SAM superfamily Fe-S cluster-containing enzyme
MISAAPTGRSGVRRSEPWDAAICTTSFCQKCRAPIDAVLFEEAGDVRMRKTCPRCGESETLFFKDAGLFRKLDAFHPTRNLAPAANYAFDWTPYRPLCTTLAVDVTSRCNFRCPDCFSAAGSGGDDPRVEEILSWLPRLSAQDRRPNISLVGGESATRGDLPEIIRGIVAAGITPRLNSNGLLLDDESLLRRFRAAGLRWVILQFDGFSRAVSRRFRGEDHVDLKQRVIDKLGRQGFLIHLAVMVESRQNDAEMAEILRFSLGTPAVRRVSFFPRAQVGRGRSEGRTHLADLLAALGAGSDGQVTADDLLAFKRVFQILHQLTGHPQFLNRRCQTPFLVTAQKNTLIPINRLPSRPDQWVRFARSWRDLYRVDRGRGPGNVMPVNIEALYDTESFDLTAARNCHHVYMTPRGYVPFCIYNSLVRETGVSAEAHAK